MYTLKLYIEQWNILNVYYSIKIYIELIHCITKWNIYIALVCKLYYNEMYILNVYYNKKYLYIEYIEFVYFVTMKCVHSTCILYYNEMYILNMYIVPQWNIYIEFVLQCTTMKRIHSLNYNETYTFTELQWTWWNVHILCIVYIELGETYILYLICYKIPSILSETYWNIWNT